MRTSAAIRTLMLPSSTRKEEAASDRVARAKARDGRKTAVLQAAGVETEVFHDFC